MSFFSNIVSSIGGDKAPAPPIAPPSRPTSTKPQQTTESKSTLNASSAANSTPVTRPTQKGSTTYKGTAGASLNSSQSNGLKRKAESPDNRAPVKIIRPNPPPPGLTSNVAQKASSLGVSEASNPSSSKQVESTLPLQVQPAKAPARGSYADMIKRAKEAQQQRPQSQVGMIKHQASDKVKVSKLAERKREGQDKAKNEKNEKNGRNGTRPTVGNKGDPRADARRRSTSPLKRAGDQPKQARAPRPPLHAPSAKYKGTLGTRPHRRREERQPKSRMDEYLATDEEDEGDFDEYDEDRGFYSDESDMEGGFDELEAEEQMALQAAKKADAQELALEAKLKREKLERKQKLAAMASKKR